MVIVNNVGCIFRVNDIYQSSIVKSELYTETAEGERAPLFDENGGRLFITDDGFSFQLSNGSIIRQGSETDIFKIVDSMAYDIPIIVEVEGKAPISFEKYEIKYGVDRLDRDNKRRFYAYTERLENETVIGINEYWKRETLAVHSLYFPEKLSIKKTAEKLGDFIVSLLEQQDYGIVICNGFDFRRAGMGDYFQKANFKGKPYSSGMEQARLLFEDSVERKESISEVFNEPFIYEVKGVFDDGAQKAH